jgi:hypothetical protein
MLTWYMRVKYPFDLKKHYIKRRVGKDILTTKGGIFIASSGLSRNALSTVTVTMNSYNALMT